MEDMERRLEEMLTCSVCRDIFNDPRQLPCGHSMCMSCLENLRDHSADSPFRCPDCREFFGMIVGVQRSYTLTNIVQDFRDSRSMKNELAKIVYCDFCPDKQTLAIKTCLKCEVSLCKDHAKDHLELPVFTGHPLVEPLGDLPNRKCPNHDDAVLKYYCRASRGYICTVCSLESKQQNLNAEASAHLQRKLTVHMDQCFETLRERMKQSDESIKRLQENIQHEKKKVNPADSPLNLVSAVLLCLWFIVLYYAYNFCIENQTLRETLGKQQNHVNHIHSIITELLAGHPLKRHLLAATEDKEALMLDLDTASNFLKLSADLRTAERVKTKMGYPPSDNRFTEAPQVLSAQCFSSGTHVWEVEVEGYWDIAVSYKSTNPGSQSISTFGNNAESWSLTHNNKGQLIAYHDRQKKILSKALQSNRLAVMVDIEKGNITFASVEPSVRSLHEFKATLTQPVCLGVGLYGMDTPSRASILGAS